MDNGWNYSDELPPVFGYDIGPDEDRQYDPEEGTPVDAIPFVPRHSRRQRQSTLVALRADDIYHEINRRKTFDEPWPSDYFVSADELARNGFIYIGPEDKVQCVFCRKTLWNWEPGDSVEKEHKKHYPRCPFVRGECDQLNVPINSSENMKRFMGINVHSETDHCDLSALADCSNRISTFRDWPHYVPVEPAVLAEAGFYYFGKEDVKCFSCGLVVRSWQSRDNPWFKHAKLSPLCRHVLSVKGARFVQIADELEKHPESQKKSLPNELKSGECSKNEKAIGNISQPLESRSHEQAKKAPATLEYGRQIDEDLKNPTVLARMFVYDITVEQMRKLLEGIRIEKGSSYKITERDFSHDLADAEKNKSS